MSGGRCGFGAGPGGAGRQRGMAAIAAIVVLVGLAALAAAIVRISSASHSALAQSTLVARASQAARAGTEWGLYQAFKGSWTSCSGASSSLDLSSETGLWVRVSCDSTLYYEGESSPGVPQTVRVFTIDAVACNSPAGCPNAAQSTKPGYIERRRQVQAVE